jgi:hypothetical protein
MESTMTKLVDYILSHSERGSCQCGKCFDAPAEAIVPEGHTADVIFFQVSAKNNPDPEKLRELLDNDGAFLLSGGHSYLEIGAWIGDQGAALQLMALGSLLGLWALNTPRSVFGTLIPEEKVMELAGMGMVEIGEI